MRQDDIAGRSTITDRVGMELIDHFFPEEGNSPGSIQSPTVMPMRWITLKIKRTDKKKEWHLTYYIKKSFWQGNKKVRGLLQSTEIKVDLLDIVAYF